MPFLSAHQDDFNDRRWQRFEVLGILKGLWESLSCSVIDRQEAVRRETRLAGQQHCSFIESAVIVVGSLCVYIIYSFIVSI